MASRSRWPARDGRTSGSLELLAALGLGGGGRQATPTSSRAASASAWRSRARWCTGPRLILADEPTGSLDGDNSLAVIDLLLDAQAEAGATLVVITHDPAVAERLERRVRAARRPARRRATARGAGAARCLGTPGATCCATRGARSPRWSGVVLGVGLFSGVLFFIDGSGASMTKRALAPLAIDMQRVLTSPLGEGLRLDAAARRRAARCAPASATMVS